ncbi:hypothetical protein [Lentzea californiensis]|uniref:hypothetical protein n=1 Tax=Lentzea californiensis TaxID=438851 RepID=UPI0021661869|nr:hypothetical protein [Lentzea californiensis]
MSRLGLLAVHRRAPGRSGALPSTRTTTSACSPVSKSRSASFSRMRSSRRPSAGIQWPWAAVPGTSIHLDSGSFHRREWKDLAVVDHWRRFMAAPEAYLR